VFLYHVKIVDFRAIDEYKSKNYFIIFKVLLF
jgi:hypothetical protein